MIAVSLLPLLLAAAFLWFTGRLPWLRRAAPSTPAPASHSLHGPVPEPYEEGLLEQEDLAWAIGQRRTALEKEKALHLSQESAARIDALEDALLSLERRLHALQGRMKVWKDAILELDELRTAHSLLQGEHLDLQYRAQAFAETTDELKAELAEARRETLAELEEKESLRRQLAVLRNLTREGS